MTKFHVGDKWADQNGINYLIVAVGTTHGQAFPLDGSGELQYFSLNTGEFICIATLQISPGLRNRLTHLISSEQWIPFAEMLPDSADARPGQMLVVEYANDTPSLFTSHEGDEGWFEWCERWGDDGYERLTPSDMRAIGGTHWRYLTPPEAT